MNAERHAAPAWLLIAVGGIIFVLLVVFLLTGGMGRTLTALGWSSPDPAAASAATPTSFLPGGTHTPTTLPTLVLLAQITSSPYPTRQQCPQPFGWQSLSVRSGDTLLRLSVLYNLSIDALQTANCLLPGERLTIGETIYVPMRATPTPGQVTGTDTPGVRVYQATYLPTRLTATRTATRIVTLTATHIPPSATSRPPATATDTPAPVRTSTPTSPPDFTATPSLTSTPTSPPEPTAEPTATEQTPE